MMKLRYRIIGILLLIGIYFGYREDPGEQYVMVTNLRDPSISFPIRVRDLSWYPKDDVATLREERKTAGIHLGQNIRGGDLYYPADIESAEKIEAYLKSR